MTETAESSQLTREEASTVALAGGDPPWLAALRQAALAAYREAPWPSSTRDEDWRRTPQIDKLDPANFTEPKPVGDGEPPPYLQAALDGQLSSGKVSAVVVSDERGNLQSPLRSDATTPAPAALDLADGLSAEGGVWQSVAGIVAPPGLRKWISLNTVRTRGGACIHVGKGQEPQGYVRLLHGVSQGSASFPRTLIKLEEGASLTLVEEWLSPDADASLLAPVVEVELARGAHLTHVVFQACGDQTVLQSTVRANIGQEARYDVRWNMLGAAWQKSYFEAFMLGEGSDTRLVGLCVGRQRQHYDVQTLQDHVARGAVSDLLYRVAVADRSRSVYAGLIRVEEGAQKTNAYVQNRNLLLSPQAKADSNPTLEILANDVRCTHGSTAGRIDDNQLFYCESRGMGRDQARRLIVEGFFADVVDSFPEGVLRECGRGLVLESLEELARSGALASSSRTA
ncbi:MAG TPA: Fe-S cluster assembly protein SufD [Candidatus Dormibacteraeota bacterium]|nr:Fe-S cluster assembly protein SufD [Candidatus Dormibacteraeota bacterium]